MRISSLPWIIVVFCALATAPNAQADRININLTHTTESGPGSDGNGALGGGSWNRIKISEAALANVLVKSDGTATTVTATDTGNPASLSQAGNAIQSESWGRSNPVTLIVSGLLPNQVYKVVVYGDRHGSGPPNTDTYTVNGVEKTLPNPGAADFPLPGEEDTDYAEFVVDASPGGQITVNAPVIAGVQIEGLIDATEKGPQMDCRISKSGASFGGKGNGLYDIKRDPAQTITQVTRGARGKRYYIRIENDGDEIDHCYAMGFWSKRKADVKVIERGGDGNITSAVRAKNYRYDLCKGESRRFKVVVKPAEQKRATINVRFCGSPSTLVRGKQDCSTCALKVK